MGLFRAGLCYRLALLCVKTRGFPHSSFPEFLRVIWLRTNQEFFRRHTVFISQLINKFTAYTFVKCFFKCRNAGLSGIRSVRYRNEQECRCRNRSGAGIRGPSPVPECSGTGLKYHMSECRCKLPQTSLCMSTCPYLLNNLCSLSVRLLVCLGDCLLPACISAYKSVCLSVFCTIVHSLCILYAYFIL